MFSTMNNQPFYTKFYIYVIYSYTFVGTTTDQLT